ncbi:MAG: glycoside hydrolase family 10 protein [Prochlorococcus sp.]|nr:family 10 glycosylhydrolase [Prochlorococcaceae cyanobacterium ETNP18_MAG_14]
MKFWWCYSCWRVLAVALLITAQPRTTLAQPSPSPSRITTGLLQSSIQPPIVGVWITNSPSPLYYSRSLMRQSVNDLDRAGFTAIYLNVWSRGTTFHRSNFAPVEPPLQKAGLALDPICTLSREGHARDMKVVPWFEYGLMEPDDAEVVKQHPEWVLTRANGNPVMKMHGNHKRVWLNPSHPEVRARFIGLVIEVIKRCQMDGLQLDDHFAWPVELGYDPYTVALYKQETGASPPRDYSNRFWMKWRRRQLTGLLRELRQALVKEKLPVHISLAPGPFRFAYNNWLQDWELWTVGKLIDELVVQNYAYSLKGFAKDLDQPALRKARQWGLPVHIGVLAGFAKRTTPMPVLAEKVRLAVERGHGVIYFYWEGLWGQHAGKEGGLQRLGRFKQMHGNKN